MAARITGFFSFKKPIGYLKINPHQVSFWMSTALPQIAQFRWLDNSLWNVFICMCIQFTTISPNIAPENSWSEDDPGPPFGAKGLSSGVLAASFRKGIWSIIIYLLLIIYITLWISLIHSWKYACSHLFLFDFHHNFLNGNSWHPPLLGMVKARCGGFSNQCHGLRGRAH